MNHNLLAVNLGPIQGTGNFQPSTEGGQAIGPEIQNLFTMIFGFLTIIAGLSFLIYFIVGALTWITAGGNEKKVEDAKNYMTNGAVGLIIIIASYAIIWIVGEVLGLKILNPVETINSLFAPAAP